jgi:hypothetical protein
LLRDGGDETVGKDQEVKMGLDYLALPIETKMVISLVLTMVIFTIVLAGIKDFWIAFIFAFVALIAFVVIFQMRG